MGQVQQPCQKHACLPKPVVIALQTGQHQITLFLADGRCQHFRGSQRIELRKIVVGNMNGAIRAFG